MKRLLAMVLSLGMILSMGIVSFASETAGDIYVKDEDGRMEEWSDSELVPGKTYYIYLTDGDSDKPGRVKLDADCVSLETDKSVRITPSSLKVTKKKMDNGEFAYFGEMELKKISASSYSVDGYSLYIDDISCDDIPSFDGEVSPDSEFTVEYPEGFDIEKDPQMFYLEDEKDYYDVEDGYARVYIDSTGVKTKMLISCDTDYDSAFGNKHTDKNLQFYYFNGADAKRQMTVEIEKRGANYIYEKQSDGSLKDITNTDGKNFVFKTISLDKYILSDKPLAASDAAVPAPSVPSVPGAPTGGGSVPFNPGTGAEL